MKLKFKKISAVTLIAALCIILSSLFVMHMDFQKENYHIDETYSYILSNSHDADRLGKSDVLWERWISPEEWNEFTTVQEGEQFDYKTVYLNNTGDAHPPLFYWCLHTISSLFPNSFSMWYGLGINLIFFALSGVVIYFISRRVIHNQWLALLPVVLWGFSPIAANTAMFIRMYSLLTLLTALSVLMHIKMYQDGQSIKNVILTFLITFLGAFTQYYFVIAAFCFSVTYCVYKLVKKDYRQMFIYGFSQLFAIILLFIAFPSAITQITGSSTNNIGNEVAATFFTLSDWPITIYSYVQQVIFGWGSGLLSAKVITLIIAVAALAVLIAVKLINKKTGSTTSGPKNKELLTILIFAITVFSVIVIISKMSYKFVYVRYLYNVIPLFIIVAVMFIEWFATKFRLSKKVIACILVALSLVNAGSTMKNNISSYQFAKAQNFYDETYEKYGDIPVILLCERNTYVLTCNYPFIKNYSDTYVMSANNIDKIDTVLKEKSASDGILLLVWADKSWDIGSGYDSASVVNTIKNNSELLNNYELITNRNFCDIYYLN